MCFVLKDTLTTGHHQNLPHPISNPRLRLLISSRPIPNAQDILMGADGEHGTAYLFTQGKVIGAEEGDEQVLPETGGQAFSQADHPFAASCVCGVLPDGLDTVAEEVEVCVHWQAAGSSHMTIHGPKFFSLQAQRYNNI